jgi:hypothetical protein
MANLRGADFTECVSLESANFEDTVYDVRTRFPSAFDPRRFGLRLEAA